MKTITTLLLSLTICICSNANAQNNKTLASRIQAMDKEQNPGKNIVSMYAIIKDFRLDTINNAEEIDVMKGAIALCYLNKSAFAKFEEYVRLIKNKFNQTSYMNMGTDMLFKTGTHRDYTEVLAQKTVELYDSYKNNPLAKPAAFPLEDWNRFVKMAAYPYYESYAHILQANGKDKMALVYDEKALKDYEVETLMQSSIELYTAILESAGQEDKAYDVLLRMAKLGKSSLVMTEQLKQLYIKRTGSDTNVAAFFNSIQNNISNTYKVEIAKKIIADEKAPNFNLTDLAGKQVMLSGLKGKIVVIDFWATWCAPCIASMPAMKKLTGMHPDVVFLFVATGENGTDAEAKARVTTYIKSSKFPSNVLMDKYINTKKSFQVTASYKLTGIPTKVVIDKHGKLRFRTVGYLTDAQLINELEAMIAVAKEQ